VNKNGAKRRPAAYFHWQTDLPNAAIHLLDTGRFKLETHAREIAALMRDFLDRQEI